ncbi:caffeic acid 3-O-methyltransferase-like [Silene latifolia]|uniref:caffeic acid 3-O-methyltransferase-like n=1 Tax=Silene latifolia TaxID=37657 RepID=UPI003D76BFD8
MSLTPTPRLITLPKAVDQATLKLGHDIIDDDEEAQNFVLAAQLVQSGVLPIVLNTALELDLIGIIAKAGPEQRLSAQQISDQIMTKMDRPNPDAPSMLDRILGLLSSYSIVSCCVQPTKNGGYQREYGLGKLSKFFLPDRNGGSLTPLLALFMDPVVLASWTKLKDAILEGGIPFNKVHGVHAFEYPCIDERFNQVFNKAMFNYPIILIEKILKKYKGFHGIQSLVDVGGGQGHTLKAIISKYPTILGINFDQPHVISNAPTYPGVKHVSGDMFESVPSGDAVLMKWLLQVWSDEKCLMVLRNCYKAVPKDGKLIIIESLMTAEPETSVVAKAISQMDVYMMTKNPGGKERTLLEFIALATTAGFAGVKVKCQVGQLWVMEFYK